MNLIIQNVQDKFTKPQQRKTCCSAWMEQASKFKTSGLLDILQSFITILLISFIKNNNSQFPPSETITDIKFLLIWNNYNSAINLIFIFALVEGIVMLFVSLLAYISEGKRILFCHCFCVCCRRQSSPQKDMELMNLLLLVFLSVVFKVVLIVIIKTLDSPTVVVLEFLKNDAFLIGLTQIKAAKIGEMVNTVLWNQQIVLGLLILHAAYLAVYLAYLIYEAIDTNRRFSKFMARRICCCWCLPLEDVETIKENRQILEMGKFQQL